jgi:hypothetical protein
VVECRSDDAWARSLFLPDQFTLVGPNWRIELRWPLGGEVALSPGSCGPRDTVSDGQRRCCVLSSVLLQFSAWS